MIIPHGRKAAILACRALSYHAAPTLAHNLDVWQQHPVHGDPHFGMLLQTLGIIALGKLDYGPDKLHFPMNYNDMRSQYYQKKHILHLLNGCAYWDMQIICSLT